MLWLKLTGLVCVLFFAIGSVSGSEDFEDLSIEEEEPIKTSSKRDSNVVFEVPSKPEDALLALYFSSPDDIKKMVLSTAKKEDVDEELAKYDGKWAIEVPSLSAIDKDYSLVLKSEGKHHAIAVDLGRDFTFDKDEFVVQFEVKFINGQTCGGAYIKLLSASPNLDLKQFHDKTPYTIMFGPDKCGLDTKLHFIFRHKNPKTGEIQEKHMNKPGTPLESFFTDVKTHLYTLVIRSDNSFEVSIDQSVVKSGSLLSDFTPAVNPPAEIDDPHDKKPDSWDEREKIPDPNAKKPDDWDESAPQFVVDEEATIPEGWLTDTPKFIPDPKAVKPADWNTETDGEWEPPMIENPECESAPGCGPWEKPKKLNPNYKGKWSPPVIANPNFDGIWKPKKIPNPDYVEDKHPFKMIPIRALGLELWSMSAEIAFDNFYIGTSKRGADKFAAETWAIKKKAEMEAVPSGKAVVDGIRDIFNEYPYYVTAAVAGIFLFIGLLLYCCCRSSAQGDDAYYKKTDEPQPDIKPEESDAAGDKEDGPDADRSGSDADKDDENDKDSEEEQSSEEEKDKEKEREEEGEPDEEKPKSSNARQRTRKE